MPGQELALTGEEFHHLRQVLRLRVGDTLSLFDGAGRGFAASLLAMDRHAASVRVGPEELPSPESPLQIHLAVTLVKGEKLDLMVQKGTELGVFAFHPLITRRAELKLDADRAEGRLSRWRRVALEACKQSGRTRIPEIFPPVVLASFLGRELPLNRVVLDPAGQSATLVLQSDDLRSAPSLLAAVGPEGGWSSEELQLLQQSGFRGLRLGPRILRAETAAIMAAGMLQFCAGDLG
ncbi:MAG: 16S rRNA (uracil(1498)-N(3))-methyltransferase [Acidobacteria bacterium]|nr:16S rRNA (uracil(1498)-N(3))-methyltransferase [Acidobacteriota bacterium]